MPCVLIVDDELSIRQVLQEIVTVYGYEAQTAQSAKEALGILPKKKIDLIMLDLSMPDITGEKFLDFIRKQGFKTPVVVVSAHVDKEMAQTLGKMGISGIVTKPFEVERVIDVMNNALGIPEGGQIYGGN
ncbi:MAG: response regulator [Candidatus Latescibacteria bacterium]|jgi:DNA-binding NtrC family response regulator|nr:response regulator [Candidatus Latescibacterota bacterium]